MLVSVVGMISKERGWGFYEKLRANDTMVVQGNQQASDMLKRGERLIAVGALDSYAAEDRAAGHPMKTLYPSDGVFVIPSPTSVVKGGPSPNAAKLLAEFIISDEVQKIFPADGGFSARSDIPAPAGSPPLSSLKILPVDYDYTEKEAPRIKKRFQRDISVIRFLLESAAPCSAVIAGLDRRSIRPLGDLQREVLHLAAPHGPRVKPGGDELSKWQRPRLRQRSGRPGSSLVMTLSDQLVAGLRTRNVSSSKLHRTPAAEPRCSRSSSR